MKTNHLVTIATSIFIGSLLISCANDKQESNYEGVPSQLISVDQGVDMKREYDTKVAPFIKASKPDEDYDPTEFAYIELDSLKKYIAFLEKVERLNNKKISGIRIYYAAYPKTAAGNVKIKHPGRETFFFAPTMEQSGGNLTQEQKQYSHLQNIPFSIVPKDASNKYVGDFRPIEGLLFEKDVKMKMQNASLQQDPTTGMEETSLLLNELNLCPPPKKP